MPRRIKFMINNPDVDGQRVVIVINFKHLGLLNAATDPYQSFHAALYRQPLSW